MSIIKSILDLDLYKLTVGQLIFQKFPRVEARYRMSVRNIDAVDFWRYSYGLEEGIMELKNLSLTRDEADYLRSLGHFTEDYIHFLMGSPLSPERDIVSYCVDNDIRKHLPEAIGPWYKIMLYETFILSICNEHYSKRYCSRNSIHEDSVKLTGKTRLEDKINNLKEYNEILVTKSLPPVNLIEFGTRRRLSANWQEFVVEELVKNKVIFGTSNVNLARRLNIKPVGTFGHEYVMGMQAMGRIQDSQSDAFHLWYNTFGSALAIALNDTLGTDKFLRDFDKDLATKYRGLRHDSGDPFHWAKTMIKMYELYEINPKTKTLFFSDGLDFETMFKIHREISPEINVAFGIGTNLTNDTFIPVPQVVMKMTYCNGQPVAKLSNNPEKAMCVSPQYLEYIKYVAQNL